MTTIHMDTDQVQALSQKMNYLAEELFEKASAVESCLRGAGWEGGSHEDALNQVAACRRRLQELANEMQILSSAVRREVEQWQEIASHFDNSVISGIRSMLPSQLIGAGIILSGDLVGVQTIDDHMEYFLINGTEVQAYNRYIQGDISFNEMLGYLAEDPFEKDIVKGKVKLWESAEKAAHKAVLDGQVATGAGTLSGSLLSAELSSSKSVEYKDGNLQATGEFDAGAYVAKGTWNAQTGALGVAAVGFLGANVNGEGGIAFNPIGGDAKVKGELDAFLGGKVEGEAEIAAEIVGVDVSGGVSGGVSYGVGATGKIDVGMDDWKFNFELELGATLGVGAEVGINFEVNLQEAATSVADFGKTAVDGLF